MGKFNLTREQSIKLICKITNQDDPYWEFLTDEFYNEETDDIPTIYDVLRPIGITKEEIDKAEGHEAA